jgi:dipeptidyl aminopeptidase/acylaminoacyl peptidase
MRQTDNVRGLIAAGFLAMAGLPGGAQAKGFVPADMQRLQSVSDPAFHPDGQRLVYSVGEVDKAKDEEVSDLWAVPLRGGAPKRLTKTGHNEWQALFSPDGKSVFFLSDAGKDETTQIWRLPLSGGEAKAVTAFAQGVEDYALSPDGGSLAVIVKDAALAPGEAKPKHPKPFVTTRFQFKEDVVGYLDDRRLHLYLVNTADGKSVQLTTGPQDHYLPSFSPDGKRIAFVTKRGEEHDRHANWDIYTVEAKAGGEQKQITRYLGSDLDPYWETRPAWSPDGSKIAYVRSESGRWIYYAPWQLAVVELGTGREWQPALQDRFSIKPTWMPDSRHLVALVESPQAMTAVKVDTVSGKTDALTHGDRYDSGVAVNGRGDVVIKGSSPAMPNELQHVLKNGKTGVLTRHNAWLDGLALAPHATFRFNSRDGTALEGVVIKPVGYIEGKRYPTILRLHGGPVYQFSHEFMPDWQAYANAGFLVLAVNPRGSSGRGFDFAKAIYADWGNKDVQDVLAGVDYAVAKGWADPERLAVGGRSYGSILTNYVIASDGRFKAAVSDSGVSNSFAAYGFDMYTREYELELGTPWANPDVYERVSYPFLHADRITTPTLFQCAELDYNVPCQGTMQMYQALRSLGVPTQLVVYPDQHHGLTVPSYLEDRLDRQITWYERYLMPIKGK